MYLSASSSSRSEFSSSEVSWLLSALICALYMTQTLPSLSIRKAEQYVNIQPRIFNNLFAISAHPESWNAPPVDLAVVCTSRVGQTFSLVWIALCGIPVCRYVFSVTTWAISVYRRCNNMPRRRKQVCVNRWAGEPAAGLSPLRSCPQGPRGTWRIKNSPQSQPSACARFSARSDSTTRPPPINLFPVRMGYFTLNDNFIS